MPPDVPLLIFAAFLLAALVLVAFVLVRIFRRRGRVQVNPVNPSARGMAPDRAKRKNS